MNDLDAAAVACLERTRSAVLNVLIAVGSAIALSGLALRWRDGWASSRAPAAVGPGLIVGLIFVVVASSLVRLGGKRRSALAGPTTRAARFHRGHVGAAWVGALAVPLGLAYGWFVAPRLDAVGPFWVAALALGFLALPRGHELEGFDEPLPEGAAPAADGPPP